MAMKMKRSPRRPNCAAIASVNFGRPSQSSTFRRAVFNSHRAPDSSIFVSFEKIFGDPEVRRNNGHGMKRTRWARGRASVRTRKQRERERSDEEREQVGKGRSSSRWAPSEPVLTIHFGWWLQSASPTGRDAQTYRPGIIIRERKSSRHVGDLPKSQNTLPYTIRMVWRRVASFHEGWKDGDWGGCMASKREWKPFRRV